MVVGEEPDTISCMAYCHSMVWVGTRSGKVFLYIASTLDLVGCFNIGESVTCLETEGPRVWSATGNTVQIWEWVSCI